MTTGAAAEAGPPRDPREPVDRLLRDLRADPDGLSSREAARRLIVYGPNELSRRSRPPWWRELGRQFTHPLALLLWLAAALAVVAGTATLGAAIVAVVVLNAVLAFAQERQAERAVETLARFLPARATVYRDGRRQVIAARDLVPGDVLVVAEGDRVSADARLLDGAVEVDVSTLTGESLPAWRSADLVDTTGPLLEARDLLFSGTGCTGGQARAMVFATGMRTELGRIAALSQRVEREESPLEHQVKRVAWLIAAVAVGAGAAFLALGALVAGLPLGDAFTFAIGLLVANVPEGLLPTITLALAIGVRMLARRGAVVKRLSAVETLGSTTVICTDKTGTLTENRMQVTAVWTAAGAVDVERAAAPSAPECAGGRAAGRLVRAAALCTNADSAESGDPTETALLRAAAALGAPVDPLTRDRGRIRQFPFDATLRRMSTVDQIEDARTIHVKGAPEEVLALSTRLATADGAERALEPADRHRLAEMVDGYARRGLRLLAVAHRRLDRGEPTPTRRDDAERDLALLGLVALFDPPRPEVADAVARCHTAGIRLIVVTGDHALTAAEIARRVGIGRAQPEPGCGAGEPGPIHIGRAQPEPGCGAGEPGPIHIARDGARVITGAQLDAMDENTLDRLLRDGTELVFARSSPEAKLRIADALRAEGHVVAMTGDGVNDAPALRRADIGVAMGRSGTDVAREAATLVLTDDNFATIVEAVAAGRRVYDNVRKFILYIFAHTTPEVVPFLVFALSGGQIPLPLTVLQILAIDLGTETLPALALGREPAEPGLMTRPPRRRTEGVIQPGMLARAWLLLGGVSAVLVMAGFFVVLVDGGWRPGAPVAPGTPLHHTWQQATTMTFLGIVACQIGTALAARTQTASLRTVGLTTNRLLLWGIVFEVVFAAAVVYLPPLQHLFGTAAPSPDHLALLPVFPVVVWGVDELWRLRRRRAARVSSAM